MVLLEPCAVTSSGRPVLQAGEVERFLLDKVDLEFEGTGGLQAQTADIYKGGYVILTSLRVLWLDATASPSAGRSCWFPAHAVRSYQRRSSFAFGGSKVRLHLELTADAQGRPVAAHQTSFTLARVAMRCRGEGPEAFAARLDEVLRVRPQAAAAGPTGTGAGQRTLLPPPPPPPSLPPPPTGPQQQAQQLVAAGPDEQLLRQIMDMGFPRNRTARALLATNNQGVQQAIDYMLAFGDQPGMDDPLPVGPPQQALTGGYGSVNAPAPPYYPQPSGYGVQPQQPQQQQQQYPPVYPGIFPPQPPPQQPAAPAYPPAYAPGGWQQQQQQQQQGAGYAAAPYAAGAGAYGSAGASMYNPLLAQGQAPPQPPPPASLQQHQVAPGEVRPSIGVAGIVRREQQKTTEAGKSLDMAFHDLQALMAMAADMVVLARKFRGVTTQGEDGSKEDELMDVETQLELISMGITSPVTKESAGARYHIELSRQLADFLSEPLNKSGGMMALPDVYCLFNRARGTELVSPDDLLQAVKMWGQVGVQIKLRTFASGLTVVQSAAHSDDQVCSRIAAMARPAASSTAGDAGSGAVGALAELGPAITAGDVARSFGIATTIAAEHLLLAEARGVVCRDDGPEGLRFFRNFFPEAQFSAAA